MRAGAMKKLLALVLTASMAVSPLSASAAEVLHEDGKEVSLYAADGITVPEPYYEFTFDRGVTDGKVENEGSKAGVTATISGSGTGLGVTDNEIRGSKVLNLPGEGLNKGSLLLPDNMFADVTDAGFAFSFWINIDAAAGQYNRIFSATPLELNSNDGDGGAWNAPEFTFVVGSETNQDMAAGGGGYNSSIMLNDRSSQLKLVWEKQFSKGAWQHVTVSVSPADYQVYLDGAQVNMTYDRNNNKSTILSSLFADDAAVLKSYTHNAIGRSVYSTDNDIKAQMDEFRFYNTALTSEQAKAAYDSYAVQESVVKQLEDKVAEAQAKSISFYTSDSYAKLQTAISEGQAGIENPVTEANVNRLIGNLDTALTGLKYYEGITKETSFSNAQLTKETREANVILSQGGLSADSEKQIQAAVAKADQALRGTDQKAVDEALQAVRAAVGDISYGATLHFNADPAERRNELFHGSTGFLYGVSEIGVPSADLISAIKPKILVQKAADGKQHPSGDGYRLTPYLRECGVENIQIYLQDYYLEWPYEYNGIDDYQEKVDAIVKKMVDGKTEGEIEAYSFVLFNEPDGIWYSWGGGKNYRTQQEALTALCNDWLTIYDTVKNINPSIKVAGPNFSVYNSSAYKTFFDFCQKNSCLPEYITWHELQKDKLASFKSHCDEVKGYVETYYADSGIDPIIFVNETVNFDDVGNPGALVNWLSIFDEEDVYASLPYWGLANSLNELAADANKPNGAWWVYRWYAQMTGRKTPLTLENIEGPGAYGRLYGLTSVDDQAGMVYSLFGGQAGKQTVSIENIKATKTFAGAEKAHVKLYSTKYTGHHGFADEIPVEFEGNLAFSGNDLVFTVPDAELMDAYYAVITPATSETVSTMKAYEKNWEKTYEAEEAELLGGAKAYIKKDGGDLARSNRAEVGSLDTEDDGVKFTVDVPKSGRYRLNIYYSSQAPQVNAQTLEYVSTKGQNRAIGALSRHTLTIDNGQPQEIVYDSTVKWGYYNYKTVYVDLTAGSHMIQLMYKGESQKGKEVNSMLCALLDKIDLTYAPDASAVIRMEPEELVGSQTGFALSQKGSYSGAGIASGSGTFELYVCVPRDGYYTVGTSGSGSATLLKNRVNYAADAKAESQLGVGWMELFPITLGNKNAGKVYLTAGINCLGIRGNGLMLDQLTFTEEAEYTQKNSYIVEAEDCGRAGSGIFNDGEDYNYLPGSTSVPTVIDNAYASGKKAVEGFRGGGNNSLTMKVSVPAAGDYKLSVVYANDEPAPVMKKQNGENYVHPYNTDLVERYMQISVNGAVPQTVYFKNTLCWDSFKNTVVDVKLKKGENIITFTNDNSYKFSELQDDFTPRLDKFVIASAAVKTADTTPVNPPVKKENKITGVSGNIKKVYGSKAFTLKAKGQGSITYTSGNNKVVTVGKSNGKVTIKGCGKAVITINAAGNSSYKAATKKVTVTVSPKKATLNSVKSTAKKTITVKWKRDKKADGYQIQYSTSKKFKGAKTVTVKKNKTTTTKIKKGLKAGKRYYVRVRAYKNSGKTKICGSYSKGKNVKVKK